MVTNSPVWVGSKISDIKKQKAFGTEFVVFHSGPNDDPNRSNGIFMFDKSAIVEGAPDVVTGSIRDNIGKLTFENAPTPPIDLHLNSRTQNYEIAVEGNDNILSIAWIEEVAAGVEYNVTLSGLRRNELGTEGTLKTYKFERCTSSTTILASNYPGLRNVQDIQIVIKDDEPHVFYNIIITGGMIMEARRH